MRQQQISFVTIFIQIIIILTMSSLRYCMIGSSRPSIISTVTAWQQTTTSTQQTIRLSTSSCRPNNNKEFVRYYKTTTTPFLSKRDHHRLHHRMFSTTTPSSSSSSSSKSTTSTDQQQQHQQLVGIEWLQDTVVDVLNELYDYKEVARGQALAKIQKQQQQQNDKKKKKKKKSNEEATATEDATGPVVPVLLSDTEIEVLVQEAVNDAKPFTRESAMVTPATKIEFGDYQINAAMGLAQAVGTNPRDCATHIANAVQNKLNNSGGRTDDSSIPIFEIPTIAGPGFINLKYTTEYLQDSIKIMASTADGRLGIPTVRKKQKIIVDFSSPNIAKEMHVGHLRSTIIGDTISSVLEFVGHEVVRLNHVGDWGTQFGMLVEHLRDEYPQALNKETSQNVNLGDLVLLYKAAKKRFDVDDEFKQRAREGVVKLQAGNPEELAAWESLCAASRIEYQKIYDLLNIKNLQERGESFYNPYLQNIIKDLELLGLAVESEGATVVYVDGYTNRDGTALPMLVQKTDGGYNYATTDLAAIRHRTSMSVNETGELADRVLYVTDAGQAQHFDMVFNVARKAQFVPSHVSLEHVPFGLVQGADGKKFATRSGDTVKLKDLLLEAIKIAGDDLKNRNVNTSDAEAFQARVDRVAQIVGIGAVKYADLSMNRESNYRFSYERMLSLNGNTAPYMLYAYARICGIIRKASGQEDTIGTIEWPQPATDIILSHESEIDLIRSLVKVPDIIYEVERDLYPNKICDYLFDISQKFNKFYENCSVNNAGSPELKASRLTICTATAGTIRVLLTLLGIETVEKL